MPNTFDDTSWTPWDPTTKILSVLHHDPIIIEYNIQKNFKEHFYNNYD